MTIRGLLLTGLLGLAIAGGAHLMMPSPNPRVALDVGAFGSRRAARELLQGRPLTPDERESLRRRLVDEELLLVYAREEGLQGGAYVERRLIRKMRFLLMGDVQAPSDGELRAIYDANPQRFEPAGADRPLPFERVKDQMRALVVGPMARAIVDARVDALVRRYTIVIED